MTEWEAWANFEMRLRRLCAAAEDNETWVYAARDVRSAARDLFKAARAEGHLYRDTCDCFRKPSCDDCWTNPPKHGPHLGPRCLSWRASEEQ